MNKSCDNCYWEGYKNKHCIYKKNKPDENVCEEYDFECNECEDLSKYKLNNEYYCESCLLEKFNVIRSTETHYWKNGKYLGSNKDIEELISSLDNDIEIID